MICTKHQWTKKTLPCPWLRCPNGARGLWIITGKRKKVVYVRRRDKNALGPLYDWEKTSHNPGELLSMPDEEELVF